MTTVTIDEKYRVYIPKELRDEMRPGDALFVVTEQTAVGPVVRYAKAINPFDALAQAALEESERGETASLADFAREHGIDLAALRAERDADAG